MPAPTITTAEFEKRRDAILKSLKDSVGLIFSGDGGHDLRGGWKPDPTFEYLTGITNEGGRGSSARPAQSDRKQASHGLSQATRS